MDRFHADHVQTGSYKPCRTCGEKKLFFIVHLDMCLYCAYKVPRWIPDEQVDKFLSLSRGK